MDPTAALELWRASSAADGRRPSAAATATAAEWLDGALLVGQPDGFAAGHVEGDLLALEAVVVLPAARRQGLGGALADQLADAAYALGARRVTAVLPGADAFVAACGLELQDGAWVGELEPPLRELAVRVEGLRLGQLLKLAGLVETGAEAKALLAEGGVLVNGEPEARRGRQVAEGDLVVARDQAVRVRAQP